MQSVSAGASKFKVRPSRNGLKIDQTSITIQSVCRRQFWIDFGLILVPFWEGFGRGLEAPWRLLGGFLVSLFALFSFPWRHFFVLTYATDFARCWLDVGLMFAC